MKKNNEPIDARIRLAIAQWPDDAPRGSVTSFCAEHGISRKSFYAIRARAHEEGQTAALEPGTAAKVSHLHSNRQRLTAHVD